MTPLPFWISNEAVFEHTAFRRRAGGPGEWFLVHKDWHERHKSHVSALKRFRVGLFSGLSVEVLSIINLHAFGPAKPGCLIAKSSPYITYSLILY